MKKIIDITRHMLSEHLPSGSFIKKTLKTIYWSLPRCLRSSDITRHALSSLSSLPEKKFIQIGANNGISHDPLYPFLINSRWEGLMIEPNIKMMDELQKNHENSCSNLTFINAAIAEGVSPILYVADFNTGVASFDKEHVIKHIGKENIDKIKATDINLLNFNGLIEKHPNFKQCDLLLIDTEGWDGKIILSIDFNKFNVDLILFERIHISSAELEEVTKKLKEHGFYIYDCRDDRLAISENSKNEALQNVLKNAHKL